MGVRKLQGRAPSMRAEALRKALRGSGQPKILPAHNRVIEDAFRGVPGTRVEADKLLTCVHDVKERRERAHFVRVEEASWACLLEGAELVRGTLAEVVSKALEPRARIDAKERKKIQDALQDTAPDVDFYSDSMQTTMVAGYPDDDGEGECRATIARSGEGWLSSIGPDVHRGTLDEVLAKTSESAERIRFPPEEQNTTHAPASDPEEEPASDGSDDETYSVAMPAWAAYQEVSGYGGRHGEGDRVGVTLHLEPGRTDASDAQRAAMAFLEKNDEKIFSKVRDAIFAEYERRRAQAFELYDANELADIGLPKITKPERLSRLVGLSGLDVHAASSGGLAYVGLKLHCTWDEEHGLGVMLHRTRVVEIGGQDTAFLWWVADKDAKKQARRRAATSPNPRQKS